ncbi:MAG: T9SS type A sorting domain-containing protein [Candidatus Krumholzibacteriota bacterium]|nr:T9SS type A sorting domain-containing protein [Candidatus Krumholzibacteriota bacterium]
MRLRLFQSANYILLIAIMVGLVLMIPGMRSFSGLSAAGNWQSGPRLAGKVPVTRAMTSNTDKININIRTEGFDYEIIEADGENYARIRIDGCGVLTEEGSPELPFIRKLVAIPECEELLINARVIKSEKMERFIMYPAPKIERTPEGGIKEVYTRKREAYSKNGVIPENSAELTRTFYIRNQHVAEIRIYPIRCNPVTKEAEFAQEIELDITFKGAFGPVCVDNGPMGRVCENSLVNYGPEFGIFSESTGRTILGSGPGTVEICATLAQATANNTDYLIVVGHELWDDPGAQNSILQLAGKRSVFNGFNVSVIDVTNIANIDDYQDHLEIKESLYNFYHSNSAAHMPDDKLGYILLVGDAFTCLTPQCEPGDRVVILPTYSYSIFDPRSAANDMPYASFDDLNDCTPDVFIGRLSVDDPGEAAAIIDKIVAYEPHSASAGPDPWYRKFLYIGGHYDDLHELGDEVEAEVPPSYIYDELYKDCLAPPTISSLINEKINDGVSIIVEAGHGIDYYWGSDTWVYQSACPDTNMKVWYPPYYEVVDNGPEYPVIYAFSCRTAAFDYPLLDQYGNPAQYPGLNTYSPAFNRGEVDIYDCMAERLTVMPNRGAVGYIGYTRSAGANDMESVPDFVNELFRTQGMVGETVTSFFYSLVNPANEQFLVYLGDPALNPFFVEDQGDPSDDIDIAVVQGSSVVTEGTGQNVDINMDIKNVGVGDASGIYLELKEGTTLLWSGTIPALAAYDVTTVSMTAAVSGLGLHEYILTVDPGAVINELNEDNNTAIIEFDYNVDFSVVQGSFVKSSEIFGVGGANLLEVSVRNDGILSAGNIPVELTEGGDIIWSGDISELGPGSETVVSITVPVSEMGNHDYMFTINPGQVISELHTDDNSGSISIAAMYNRDGFPVTLFTGPGVSLPYAVPTVYQATDDENKRFLYKSGIINSSGSTVTTGEVAGYYSKSYDIPVGNVNSLDSRNVIGIFSLLPSEDRSVKIFDSVDLELVAELQFTGLSDGTSGYKTEGEALVYDLDRDGLDEIIYIERNYGSLEAFDGMMKIFSYKNGELTEIVSHTFDEGGGAGTYRPLEVAVEDIDFDNIPEIFVIGYRGDIEYPVFSFDMFIDIFSYDESLELVRHENQGLDGLIAVTPNDDISGNVILSDINGDDYLDMVATVNDGVATISGTDISSNTVNIQKIGTDNSFRTAVYSVDVDHSGNRELVLVSSEKVRILSVDGLWNLSVVYSYENAGSKITSGPSISDIDGDTYPEIIIGSANDLEDYYQITILDHNLVEETLWESVRLYGILNGDIAIDDIDRDSRHDLILMAETEESGFLYLFGTPWLSGGDISMPVEKGNNQHTNAEKRFIRGTFDENVTLCREVEVIGDLQINSPAVLHVAPGATIGIRDDDPYGTGVDAGRIEMTCYGGVSIKGLNNLEVSFYSNGDNPQPMDWFGLVLEANNLGGEISRCEISDAAIGIYGKNSTAPITVHMCKLNGNQSGAQFNFCNPEITYTQASYNTSSGIVISGYPVAAPEAFLDHCTMRNNTYYGIIFAFATGGIQHSFLENNGLAGILCLGANACPVVSYCSIIDNSFYAVNVLYDASPVIGNASTGQGGNNSIYNSPYYVFQDYSSPSTVIMAQNSYWGTEPGQMPAPRYFAPYMQGNVIYDPILFNDPLSGAPVTRPKSDPTRIFMSQNYPNPFNGGSTSINYSIPAGGAKVSLKIYDVAGRRVRTLVEAIQPSGSYQVNWDGQNENGAKVAQGIYFYRLVAGEETISKKMIYFR